MAVRLSTHFLVRLLHQPPIFGSHDTDGCHDTVLRQQWLQDIHREPSEPVIHDIISELKVLASDTLR